MEPEKGIPSPTRKPLWPLALLGILGFSWLRSLVNPPYQQLKPNISPRNNSSQKGNYRNDHSALTAERPQPPQHTEITCECCHHKTPWWKIFFDGVALLLGIATLIVLCIYAFDTHNIWRETKKTANIAGETLSRSQRPWVHPTAVTLTHPLTIQPTKIVARGTVTIKNYGSSPALYVLVDVHIVADLKEFKRHSDSACNLVERMSQENEFSKGKFGSPIFPQDIIFQPFAASDETPHPNLTVLYFAGCIIYQDQFEKSLHHTYFCFETPTLATKFSSGDSLVSCNIGQEVD